jgi:uroporphyrin-III C-methyltransferase
VTGADVSGGLPEGLNWPALTDPEATTVVYMGRRTWAKMAAHLIEGGLSPDTPALLAEAIGQRDQRLTRATIATLADTAALTEGTAAALILYGPLADGMP